MVEVKKGLLTYHYLTDHVPLIEAIKDIGKRIPKKLFIVKEPVVCATVSNINANYYYDSDNKKWVLEGTDNGTLPTIDGITLNVNDRVLIKDQTNKCQNGVYTVVSLGDNSSRFKLVRSDDLDEDTDFDGNIIIPVKKGQVNSSKTFTIKTENVNLVQRTDIEFTELFLVPGGKIEVSETDKIAGYLNEKIIAGDNIIITKQTDPNGSEQLVISGTGGGISGSGTRNYLAKWSESNILTNSVIYDNGTNVGIGIGTISPGAKLHVKGNLYVASTDNIPDNIPGPGNIILGNFNSGIYWPNEEFSDVASWIKAFENRLEIASPGYRLNLSEAASLLTAGDNWGSLLISENGTFLTAHSGHDDTYRPDTNRLELNTGDDLADIRLTCPQNFWVNTGGADRFIVNAEGNVGIGTTVPEYKLDVSGDLRVNGQTIFNNVAYTWPSTAGSPGQVLTTDGTGNLSWTTVTGGGWNGNAESDLNMNNYNILNMSTINGTGGYLTWLNLYDNLNMNNGTIKNVSAIVSTGNIIISSADANLSEVTNSNNIILGFGDLSNNYDNVISIGYNTYNNYESGVGIGNNVYDNNYYGIGIGYNAYNNYDGGIGIGYYSNSNHTYGIGIGCVTYNNKLHGLGIGYYANNNYFYGIGIGYYANNNYFYGIGIGCEANNNSNYAIGIGCCSQNNQPYSTSVGGYTFSATNSVSLGWGARSEQMNSVSLGAGARTTAQDAVSIGAYVVNNDVGTVKIGVGTDNPKDYIEFGKSTDSQAIYITLKSPNGTRFRIQVDDDGVLTVTQV
jgi:hypothetical protein